jgi:hypothetical protein
MLQAITKIVLALSPRLYCIVIPAFKPGPPSAGYRVKPGMTSWE